MQVRRNGNVLVIMRRAARVKGSKPPKPEVVARLRVRNLKISDEVRKKLSPAELAEVTAAINSIKKAEAFKAEHAVRTMPEQVALALAWFKQHDDAEGHAAAQELLPSLSKLRNVATALAGKSE